MSPLCRGPIRALCCCVFALVGCTSNGPTAASTQTPTPPAPTAPTPPITGTPITITAKAKFAYSGNQGASLSGYAVDTSTGTLTALNGFPLAMGTNPIAVAVDPQNRFLFVGDSATDELHILTIASSTGALSEISISPYATVHEPSAIAVDPSGTHIYVASYGSNSVGGFSVSSTGALTLIAGSPFATSGTQQAVGDVIINAAGTFVYVQDIANLYTYSVNANSGALTLIQTIAGPSAPGGIALDPHGTYLYAVGSGTDSILAYSIDASTGLLRPATSSPLVEQSGAYTLSISPTGQYAYTIENNNDLVSYALNNGVFTHVGTVYAQVYGLKIGIDPSGGFVYVPQACNVCSSGVYNVIHEFLIGSTGTLTKIPGSPVAAGTTPWGIAFTTQ